MHIADPTQPKDVKSRPLSPGGTAIRARQRVRVSSHALDCRQCGQAAGAVLRTSQVVQSSQDADFGDEMRAAFASLKHGLMTMAVTVMVTRSSGDDDVDEEKAKQREKGTRPGGFDG